MRIWITFLSVFLTISSFAGITDSVIIDLDQLPPGKRQRMYDALVAEAQKHVGTPYKIGGCNPGAFDCSGFVSYVFKEFEIELPRTSKQQAKAGKRLWCKRRRARKGDLLFFRGSDASKREIAHVGIVITDKGEPIQFIHASTSRGVVISSLENAYYDKRLRRGRRFKVLRKKLPRK